MNDNKPCCASSHVPIDTACRVFESGMNGRCVYCDHESKCHPGPGATCWIGVTQIALLLLACVLLSGCCSHREGDIAVKGGEAYVFEKVLTREQIREGNEIRAMQNRVEGMNSFSQPNAKLIVDPSMTEYVKTNKPKDRL